MTKLVFSLLILSLPAFASVDGAKPSSGTKTIQFCQRVEGSGDQKGDTTPAELASFIQRLEAARKEVAKACEIRTALEKQTIQKVLREKNLARLVVKGQPCETKDIIPAGQNSVKAGAQVCGQINLPLSKKSKATL